MVTVKFTVKGRPEMKYPDLEALEGKYSKKYGYYSKPSYSFKQIRRDMRAEFKSSGEKPYMIKHSRGTPRATIPSFKRMHRRRIFEIPKEKPTSYGRAKPIHRVVKKRKPIRKVIKKPKPIRIKKRVIKKRKRRVRRLVVRRKTTRRKKLGRPRTRTRARHYGDNPKIRRTHGERKYNPNQPWERAYRKRKRKLARLKRLRKLKRKR